MIGSVVYGSVLRNSLLSGFAKYVPMATTGAGLPRSSVAQLVAGAGWESRDYFGSRIDTGDSDNSDARVSPCYVHCVPEYAVDIAGACGDGEFLPLFACTSDKKNDGIVAGTLHKGERMHRDE